MIATLDQLQLYEREIPNVTTRRKMELQEKENIRMARCEWQERAKMVADELQIVGTTLLEAASTETADVSSRTYETVELLTVTEDSVVALSCGIFVYIYVRIWIM